MFNLLKQYGINPEDILNLQSEEKQIQAIKENGYRILHISNPSEKVQLQAVKQGGFSIRYISNPSEKVQLEAVKQNGHSIRYISNPSEKVQRLFVKYILQQKEDTDMNQYCFHKLSRDVMEDLLKQITIKNIIT